MRWARFQKLMPKVLSRTLKNSSSYGTCCFSALIAGIFEDLAGMRERREMLSLTIEEVERHIHVRAVLLHALEQGAMQELPSPVQTRGMFANYASFFGS